MLVYLVVLKIQTCYEMNKGQVELLAENQAPKRILARVKRHQIKKNCDAYFNNYLDGKVDAII